MCSINAVAQEIYFPSSVYFRIICYTSYIWIYMYVYICIYICVCVYMNSSFPKCDERQIKNQGCNANAKFGDHVLGKSSS